MRMPPSGALATPVTKNGSFAYTSNTASNTISSYVVAKTGALSLLTVAAAPGSVPIDMSINHSGQFLYIRNAGDGTVTGFRIQSDGSLKQIASAGGLPDGAMGLAAW